MNFHHAWENLQSALGAVLRAHHYRTKQARAQAIAAARAALDELEKTETPTEEQARANVCDAIRREMDAEEPTR